MAKKDDILRSFMTHDILRVKYNIADSEIPSNLREGLNSNIPIIKAISLIVDKLESTETIRDNDLRNLIIQYLIMAKKILSLGKRHKKEKFQRLI